MSLTAFGSRSEGVARGAFLASDAFDRWLTCGFSFHCFESLVGGGGEFGTHIQFKGISSWQIDQPLP